NHYKNYDKFMKEKKYDRAQTELTGLRDEIERMRDKDYWKNTEARDALLADLGRTLDREQRFLTHEQDAVTGAPQQLGRAQGGRTPIKRRPIATLTMGQGLVTNLGQMILFSNEFASCSPIVMFNSGTYMGGLFHFPALGKKHREESLEAQKPRLRAMYKR